MRIFQRMWVSHYQQLFPQSIIIHGEGSNSSYDNASGQDGASIKSPTTSQGSGANTNADDGEKT